MVQVLYSIPNDWVTKGWCTTNHYHVLFVTDIYTMWWVSLNNQKNYTVAEAHRAWSTSRIRRSRGWISTLDYHVSGCLSWNLGAAVAAAARTSTRTDSSITDRNQSINSARQSTVAKPYLCTVVTTPNRTLNIKARLTICIMSFLHASHRGWILNIRQRHKNYIKN